MSDEQTMYDVEIAVPEGAECDAAGQTETIEVSADEFVLAAARREGLWLPADCQQGWCTTCAAELLEGDVDQSASRRYYDVDREEGYALICTAKPRSDLRIRACKHEEMLGHRAAHDLPPGSAKR